MGKRKNRSKAMCLAAKRRGGAPKPGVGGDGSTSGFAPAAADNKQKTVFDDDDDDDDDDIEPKMRTVPPPPPPPQQTQMQTQTQTQQSMTRQHDQIVLPRTNAPWFSRTLSAHTMTHFEDYYRRQNIIPDGEWDSFLGHLRKPLPVTFRMSEMASHRHGVAEALAEGKDLLRPRQPVYNDNGRQIPPPKRLEWCNGWQLGCDKMALKFSHQQAMYETQRWLVKYNSTGVLTRQAVDSMVPAAILQVEPHHRVLDLCASPGSKTTQLLEALNVNNGGVGGGAGVGPPPTGCVVANDINPRRCYFLVRRCAALGAATQALAVTNHHAQWFPNSGVPLTPLPEDITTATAGGGVEWPPLKPLAPPATREKLGGGGGGGGDAIGRYPEGVYDRIICDVPCSGDGTLRKNPQIWSEWRPEFAMGLHGLQLRIAQRGAALLKVGGYMVYSTCSFNPVENEAVVAELIKRCGGALEIVDASDRVRDLQRRPGMTSWKVITMVDDNVVEYPTFDDSQQESVSVGLRRKFERSMWPPKRGVTNLGKRIKGPPLERCMRLVPHLQDMGGFFATLLKKVAPLPGPDPKKSGVERAMSGVETSGGDSGSGTGAGPGFGGVVGGIPRTVQEHRYIPAAKKVIKALAAEWEMDPDSFASDLAPNIYTRSDKNRALTYLSPGVKDQCVDAAGAARIKCVWSGVRVWEKRGTALGERGDRSGSGEGGGSNTDEDDGMFPYRLTQEGAVIVARHAGQRRRLLLPARDLKQLLKELGKDVPLKSLTPAVSTAARAMTPGSVIVELKKLGGGGGATVDEACPPIAVELTPQDTLRVEWRFRKGLEGAPKAASAAILRRLDAASDR